MSRSILDTPARITLAAGDWIEIKKLSYAELLAFSPDPSDKKDRDTSKDMGLLKKAIVAWNFTFNDGTLIPCTPEQIDLLDVSTILELTNIIAQAYVPEKKSVTVSTSTS